MSLNNSQRKFLAFAIIAMTLACPAYLFWSAGSPSGAAWIDFAMLGLCLAISVLMSYVAIGTRPNRLETFFLVTGIGAALLFATFELIDLFVWHRWGAASVSRYSAARMVAAGDWMLFSIVASAIVAAPIGWLSRAVGLVGAWLAFSFSSFEIGPTLVPLSTPWRSGALMMIVVVTVIALQSWMLTRKASFHQV